MAITAVLRCSVEYFTPVDFECVLCSLEPLLLFFQAPRCGNKPLVGVMLLLAPVRCGVVRTVIFDGVGLFGLIPRVSLVGRWFTLLYRWVYMIVIYAEAGFGAVFTPPL